MGQLIKQLETQLDSFSLSMRSEALKELLKLVKSGEVEFARTGCRTNMHLHSFFSFNACGYSPSKIAWLAKKTGLAAAGMVDFDVFDGLEEFYEAATLLGLKVCAGMEARVYVPEFADKVINSPGEPGVAYHIGTGIPKANMPDELENFKTNLRNIVENRNLGLIEKINKYLTPVELDYERDVLPLTPTGNATERHITVGYAKKAQQVFKDIKELEKFWCEKLNAESNELEFPEGVSLLNLIRAKTMKRGGIGYVQPDAKTFPTMSETNEFILAAGGIPTLAWLDGTSEGEKEIETLLETAMKTGVEAVNIIPERNYTQGKSKEDVKYIKLCEFIELAQRLDLPVIVGTEMNSPGQKFVDDFESRQLKPFVPVFVKGAYIVYAHSVLQRAGRIGYTSRWAKKNFRTRVEKNEFFEKVGKILEPGRIKSLCGLDNTSPQEILEKITN